MMTEDKNTVKLVEKQNELRAFHVFIEHDFFKMMTTVEVMTQPATIQTTIILVPDKQRVLSTCAYNSTRLSQD